MDVVSIVEGLDASRHVEEILSAAQQEVLVLDGASQSETQDSGDVLLSLLSKGVPSRAVYDLTALEIEGRMGEVEERVAVGQQARVTTQRLQTQLSIIDRRIASMPADISCPGHGTVLIQEPFLVEALVARFEALWDLARPLSPDTASEVAVPESASQELSQRDIRILQLLAAGEKDVAIARQLGTSPVTIRRRIRRSIAALGVETRFQAGVAATKRGWL